MTDQSTSSTSFFREQFGLDESSLSAALGTALERQVDYADLFFEYSTQDSVALEEGIVTDTITCSAEISTCEKGQQWQRTLGLLEEMRRSGIAAVTSHSSWPSEMTVPSLATSGSAPSWEPSRSADA